MIGTQSRVAAGRVRGVGGLLRGSLLLFVAAFTVLGLGGVRASATVAGAPPTWPIPANTPLAPPPIPQLPPAGETPPPGGVIADPITPGASCGGWYRQSSYGDRWPA